MKKAAALLLILTVLLIPCLSVAAADSWDFSLPANLTKIEASAFAGDTSLNRVYVGDGVTTIGAQAFANSSLRDIRLPESLTEIAADAFRDVPHVEVYGAWNDDFFAGMDNVAMSGSAVPVNESTFVPVAPGQEVWRTVPVSLVGKWYFGVENCSSATLYNSKGEKIDDLTFGSFAYYLYHTFSETEDVMLCIRNDTDALISAKVYVEAPYEVLGLISVMQAEPKFSASLQKLYYVDPPFPLDMLEAHQYYAPAFQATFNGTETEYTIDLYVDDLLVKHWEGSVTSDTQYEYFMLEPEDVMKYNGFDAGEHTVRIEADGAVSEYSYELNKARAPQVIGPEASSLYLLPEQHVFAQYTADSTGVFTIQSDIPKAMQIYGRLLDEDGNILDSKEEPNEEYDFYLSANLTAGQTVTLEAWLDSQKEESKPFYGVVTLIVGDPSSDGADIFKNAQCRALVIGQTYKTAPETISRLDGCRTDADSMAAMLSKLAGSPYAVTKQIDLDAADILAAIPAAFAGATENDVSLFYYSGHGATGSGSLVGNDGEGISPESLRAALDQIPGTKIILLDSCFSGYFIGRGSDDAAEAEAALNHFMSVFSWNNRGDGNAYYVLTASSLYETSIGYKGASSLFTRNLVEGMGYTPDGSADPTDSAPADANQDGMFTLDELFVYCRNQMRQSFTGQTVCPWPYNSNQVLFIREVPEQ